MLCDSTRISIAKSETRHPHPPIALAMLNLGGHRPALPGRS